MNKITLKDFLKSDYTGEIGEYSDLYYNNLYTLQDTKPGTMWAVGDIDVKIIDTDINGTGSDQSHIVFEHEGKPYVVFFNYSSYDGLDEYDLNTSFKEAEPYQVTRYRVKKK